MPPPRKPAPASAPKRGLSKVERTFAAAIAVGLALGLMAFAADRLNPRAHVRGAADAGAPPDAAARTLEGAPAEDAHGYLGVKLGLDYHATGKLDDVLVDGPAYREGLRAGDVIERIDGRDVRPRGGSPRPTDEDEEPRAVAEDLRFWTHLEGDRWSDVTFRVRGKGDLRVRRELSHAELLDALKRHEKQALTALAARLAARQARQRGELAAAQRKAADLPGWFEEAWSKHATAARDQLDELLAGPGAPDGLRTVREALDRHDYAALHAGMARAGDVVAICVANPRTMALPPHLHDLATLAGLAEARRLIAAGRYEDARKLATAAGDGDGFSYSTDDPRYAPATVAAVRDAAKLEELGGAAARTTAALARVRARLETGPSPTPRPELP